MYSFIVNNVNNVNKIYDFIEYGNVQPILMNVALYSLAINNLVIDKKNAKSYITP